MFDHTPAFYVQDTLREHSHVCIQRKRFSFALNGVTSCVAEVHWGSVASLCFAYVACGRSCEKFDFSSGSTGASQSNHVYANVPAQALANQITFMQISRESGVGFLKAGYVVSGW